jgi:hypothetical protein
MTKLPVAPGGVWSVSNGLKTPIHILPTYSQIKSKYNKGIMLRKRNVAINITIAISSWDKPHSAKILITELSAPLEYWLSGTVAID